jgi:hypothetical protein
VLFRAQKMLKFGAPLMVATAGWGGESIPRALALISNFTAVFSKKIVVNGFTAVVKRKPLLSL